MNDVKVKTSIPWDIDDIQWSDETLTDETCTKVLNYLQKTHGATKERDWNVLRNIMSSLDFQFPKCTHCGEEVESGYIFEKNHKFKTKTYFCSEKCLKEYFPDEDMNKYNSNYHSCIERVSSKLV